MSIINNKYDRIVVLVDMDCFYCQVEEKLNPSLKGKPIAVVQYNKWKGGGIIAVNYPARDRGVTRHMRGDEAKDNCPEIELVHVPSVREKADLTKYREAGKQVASVLQSFTPLLERASVDEAYLDITENVLTRLKEMNKGEFTLTPDKLLSTYAVGYESIGDFVKNISIKIKEPNADLNINNYTDSLDDTIPYEKNNLKLLIGASIVNEIRLAVKNLTGYECSAGIAHNKILGKLVCGINKPNKQTLLPLSHINHLYSTLSLKKIKGLGGKFGDDVCEILKIKLMSELTKFSLDDLQKRFDEKNGMFLHLISRGIDLEPVTPRFSSKSIGCCKKFPGRTSLKGIASLEHWLAELATEIVERLEKDEIENRRRPKQMVVSYSQEIGSEDVASSRSIDLHTIGIQKIATDALETIKKNTTKFFLNEDRKVLNNAIKFLGISVGKFEDLDKKQQKNTIISMFNNQNNKKETEVSVTNEVVLVSEEEEEEKEAKEIPGPSINRHPKSVQTIHKSPTLIMKPEKPSFFERRDKLTEPEVSAESEKTSTLQNFENSESNYECLTQENSAPTITETVEVLDLESPSSLLPPLNNDSSIIIDTTATSTEKSPKTNDDPTTSDYRSTYAEFHKPTNLSEAENELTQCSQCNKRVRQYEMQSHMDAHFAFKLSQEQRLEFRNQMSNQKSTPQPVTKKPKLDLSTPKNNKKMSVAISGGSKLLKDFLIPKIKPVVNTPVSVVNDVPFEECSECGIKIKLDKILEHMDFHAAKKLQQELNKQTSSSSNSHSNSLIRGGGGGSGGGTGSGSGSKKRSGLAVKKSTATGASAGGGSGQKNTTSVANFFKSN